MMSKEKEKKSHGVQLLLRAVVRDPDGKIISDTGEKPSRSFVLQFLELLHAIFTVTSGSISRTDTSGAETIIYHASAGTDGPMNLDAGINTDTYGLVVGTGDTAEDNTDHKLATQLTEGVGAGNITHGAMTVGSAGEVGANVDIEVKRSFVNNTGSLITVKEAGVYCGYGAVYFFCLVRDVLAASVNVPDKCALTLYYTFRTTV